MIDIDLLLHHDTLWHYDPDDDPLFPEKLDLLTRRRPWMSHAELHEALVEMDGNWRDVLAIYF